MAAPLAGLTGLYGTLDTDPAGRIDEGAYQLFDQQIGPQAHADPGDTAGQDWPAGYGLGYSGQGTYSDSGPLVEFNAVEMAPPLPGPGAIDDTPSTHGGKWPRPEVTQISTLYPDNLAVVGEQMRMLHGEDQGGVRAFLDAPGGHEEPVNITADRYEAPNENSLLKAVGHLRSWIGGVGGNAGGGHLGSADVDQGYGQLNDTPEFQAGHSIRYVQHDTLHFDYTGNAQAHGTWLGRHPSGTQFRFDGPDSPYATQGDISGGMVAENRSFPSEFPVPSQPTVRPASALVSQPDVFAWGG